MKNENEIQDLMHQAVAVALKQLLHPGEAVHVHELIGALWRLKQSSPDSSMRVSCERAIRLLAKKLN
ncbi:hypothetical protein HA45_12945 [Pantoea rodasii]|nr:hypothetical protein HA45_12945 [Pantoea rodasii]